MGGWLVEPPWLGAGPLRGLVGIWTQWTPCFLPKAAGDLQVWGEAILPHLSLGPDSPGHRFPSRTWPGLTLRRMSKGNVNSSEM